MRPRILCAVSAIAAAACHHNLYSGDVPTDVERVVLIEQAMSGHVLSTSPFRRYSQSDPRTLSFKLGDDYDRLRVLGFDAAEVATLEPLPDDVEKIALAPAQGCDPKLPAPSWSETLSSAGTVVANSTAAPALTASWLIGRCPNVQARLDVDARCVESRCFPSIVQSGCGLNIDLSDCRIGRYTGQVDHVGRFCGEGADSGCVFDSPSDGAFASIKCAAPINCDIEIVKDAPPPALRTATISVVPAAPARAPNGPPGEILQRQYRITGYFTDFVVLDDRVAVSTQDGRYLETMQCDSSAASRIELFDPESLAHIGTSTAPPCLMRLIESPHSGFLGVYGRGTTWYLGQFTKTGALVHETAIALGPTNGRTYTAVEALYAAATNETIVIFAWATSPEDQGHTIVAIEDTTLAQSILEVNATSVNGLTVTSDGKIAYSVESQMMAEGDSVHIIDLRSRTEIGRAFMPTLHSTTNQHLQFHEESGAIVVSTPVDDPLVFLLEGTTFRDESGRRLPLTLDFGPYASAVHPKDNKLELVGAVSIDASTPHTSLVAIYDPHQHTFRPGALRMGFGPPTSMKHALGRIWIAFPWEAKIRRIEAP